MTLVFGALGAFVLVLAPPKYRLHGAVSCCAAAIHPMVGLATFALWLAVHRSARIVSHRSDETDDGADQVLAVELVAMGLSAGVPFDDAVEEASRHVSKSTADRLRTRLRRTRFNQADAESTDPIGRMFAIVTDAQKSGAPVLQQFDAVVEQARSDRDAALDERLQRLPVVMLFPLALLILPGFLLVAVVPAVVGGISRLGI